MLGQNLENTICDDPVSEVILVHTVIMNHPIRSSVCGEHIDVEALLVRGNLMDNFIKTLEESKIRMAPSRATDGKISHVVSPDYPDER